MIEYRKARPEEREAYLAFADMVFNLAGTDISFERSLPKVYGLGMDTASLQNIAYDREKGIRGLVAVLPQTLHILDRTLKSGYIGTVSVHPEARGEGHMKVLMAMALDEMRTQGADIALLGGQRQRYEHFGYAWGGVIYHIDVNRSNVRHALADVAIGGVTLTEILPGSAAERQAQALHDARPYHFDRTSPSFAVVCRSYLHTPWAIERDGCLLGYVIATANKKHLAEVYAAAVDEMDTILKAWLVLNDLESISLDMPPFDAALLRRLCRWAESVTCGSALSARVLHYAPVVESLLKLKASYSPLEDGTLSLCCEGQAFTVQVAGNQVHVTEDADEPLVLDALSAGRLLFTPFDYEDRPAAPRSWFPLPLCSQEADAF